jgi:hypothetical protein
MKKIFITSVLSFATCTAFAGDWYGSVGLDQKDKQNVTTGEYHNVFSMTIGKKLGDGYSVEALIEDEQVRSASAKHEGLYQLRVNKDFHTETMFTPYVGLAAGMKSKEGGLNASLDFPFYRYDLGIKAKLTEQITARLGWRHRQAMDAVYDTKDTKWNTNETTLALSYKLTDVDKITAAYKIERKNDGGLVASKQSSEYNTTAISYSRAF